jgi:DNA repair exonuclease SbcCD ATPase subunit
MPEDGVVIASDIAGNVTESAEGSGDPGLPEKIVAMEVVGLAKEMADLANAARTRCQNIEEGRGYVEKVRSELDTNVAQAKKQLSEIATSHAKSAELRTQIETDATTIAAQKSQVETQATLIARIAESAAKAEEQVRITQQRVESTSACCTSVEDANRNAAGILTELTNKAGAATETVQGLSANATRGHELLGTITGVSTNIAQLKSQAETDATRIKGIADIADDSEQKVRGYENKLSGFEEQIRILHAKIESLLPGATSTGLAEAFRVRKEQFRWPHRIWNIVFIVCLLSLVGLYAFAFGTLTDIKTAPSTEELGFGLLERLPFAILLVWLALHSARQASIFKRIEEDYAFNTTAL